MPEKKMNYTEAYDELEKLVKRMENADISVDELTKSLKRASELIQICKDKLTKTESEVNKIMEQNN